jgi:hypothetical protein
MLACGGRVNSDSDAASSSGSSGSGSGAPEAGPGGDGSTGSGSGVTVPLCPVDPPTPGTVCGGPGTQGCIYLEPGGCQAFVCDETGTWETTTTGC